MSEDVTSLQIKVVSDQIAAAEKRLKALEVAAAGTEKQTDKLSKSAVSLGESFKKAGAVAQTALGIMGVGALGLVTSLGAATQSWLEFDKAIKSVNSIAGLSSAKFKALRKDTLLLASSLGVDATEAAKGLFDVFQADIPEAEALGFLESASKLAIGGGTSTSTAVNAITNVMKAYNLEASRATEISDKLFTTVLFGKAEFEGLGNALAGATVPGAALGVKFDEILAMITTITAQGTSTSEAITQIERSMQALLAPSKEMEVVFKRLNVEGGRQMIQQYGLVGSLEKVRQAYVGNDVAMVKALGSVVAFAAAVGTTGDKLDDSARSMDQITNAAGRTEKAFKTNADTLENSLNSLKASSTLLVEQMEGSLGIINMFSEALRGAAHLIAEISGSGGASFNNAMKMEGVVGMNLKIQESIRLQEKVATLKEKQQKLASMGTWDFGLAGGRIAQKHTDLQLENTIKDLKNLSAVIDSMPESEKNLGSLLYTINDVEAAMKKSTDPAQVEQYKQKLASLTGEYHKLYDTTEAATTSATEEARVKALFDEAQLEIDKKRIKEQEKLEDKQAEEAKQMKAAGEMAKDLATTEKERLQTKMALVDKAVAAGTATAAEGAEAKAALEEQIRLLDERDAKKAAGGGGGGAVPASMLAEKFELSLPELNGGSYGESEFDRLKKEEDALKASLAERQLAIEMAAAKQVITEEQKIAMLAQTQSKYTEMQRAMELERNRLMVTGVADLFGNLASVASAFGKKGAKAAKALAIIQATVKMYESATSAYASAAAIPYYGFIAAPIAAAGALAAGAVNIAAIKNQSEDINAYEHGGMIPSGHMGIVGEAGAELVKGPAMVTSARTTAGRGDVGKSKPKETTVIVHNNSREQIVEKRTNDGDRELIEFIIGQATGRVADNISKGGNSISKALEKSYNLGRGK